MLRKYIIEALIVFNMESINVDLKTFNIEVFVTEKLKTHMNSLSIIHLLKIVYVSDPKFSFQAQIKKTIKNKSFLAFL